MQECNIVPFPLCRRMVVRKLNRELYSLEPAMAERGLQQALAIERAALIDIGIPPYLAEQQVAELGEGVRTRMTIMRNVLGKECL